MQIKKQWLGCPLKSKQYCSRYLILKVCTKIKACRINMKWVFDKKQVDKLVHCVNKTFWDIYLFKAKVKLIDYKNQHFSMKNISVII